MRQPHESERALHKFFVKLAASLAVFLSITCSVVAGQDASVSTERHPLQSGSPTAAVKIEVFYDLQCGSCANFHAVLRRLEQKYGDDLLITFRHFPLRIPAHDKSFLAARIVEAANFQGKGRQMLDLILANQTKWTADTRALKIFFGYATRLELDVAKFREDFESGECIFYINDDLSMAKELKLNSTPTIFLNGKELTFIEALEIETKIKEIVK